MKSLSKKVANAEASLTLALTAINHRMQHVGADGLGQDLREARLQAELAHGA